jgi:hypothetical protein
MALQCRNMWEFNVCRELYFIKCIICFIQGVREVALHLYKVLEVMSTSVYTGLNSFNFIRKRFLQICL